jgi:glycosyltransferase involved in cell wall biosynthesis
LKNITDRFAIVTPCFNEEKSIVRFLDKLGEALAGIQQTFVVVVVDDCSEDNTLSLLNDYDFPSPNIRLTVLRLKFNSGHQSAIYQGLLYANSLAVKKVIVMDSDGEDDPRAIPLLLTAEEHDIIEVKRGKRNESISFRIMYMFYKVLFRSITGKSMDYGNYCMIDKKIVERITHTSYIHFPAYLLKQKASRGSVLFDREKRIDGKSKMGLNGLVVHAFKSFIEFGEDLLLIFLKLFILIMIVLIFLAGNIFYQKFIAGTAILGWFSTLTLGLATLAIICLGFFITGILLLNLIHQQNNQNRKDVYTVTRS